MTFYDVFSGDEPQMLKSLVVAKQSEICPNQLCTLSLLPLSHKLKFHVRWPLNRWNAYINQHNNIVAYGMYYNHWLLVVYGGVYTRGGGNKEKLGDCLSTIFATYDKKLCYWLLY